MKVLLISINTFNEPYPVYPIGLDYVAKSIEENHDVQVVDMNYKIHSDLLNEKVNHFQPHLIGISIRNIDNTDSVNCVSVIEGYKEFVKRIRSISDSLIVAGGSGFTILPEAMMSLLEVDYGIIGEGERLGLLIEALQNKEDPSSIPGIITRNGKEKVPQPWNKNFRRDFSKNSYTDFYINKGGMLNLQTKRGCCFKCIYCTYPYIEGCRLRLIDPEEVAEEAWKLQTAGAKYITITDSVFNADASHSLAVAKAIQKRGVSIPWGGFFAPLKPPKAYYEKLAEAGLRHVEFGTESLNDRQLRNYQKPFQLHHVFEAHEEALASGLHVAHYFILGGPGEDFTSVSETLSNAEKLPKTVLFFFCGMRIYPNTTLYDIAIEENIISDTDDLLEPLFYLSRAVSEKSLVKCVTEKARNRINWRIGGVSRKSAIIIDRMYARGFIGPLWERLSR